MLSAGLLFSKNAYHYWLKVLVMAIVDPDFPIMLSAWKAVQGCNVLYISALKMLLSEHHAFANFKLAINTSSGQRRKKSLALYL